MNIKSRLNVKRIFLFAILSLILLGLRNFFEWNQNIQFQDLGPVDFVRYAGIIITIYGYICVIMEDYLKLPLFTGRSQRGGSNANGPFVFALGIAAICHTFTAGVLLTGIGALLILLEQVYIAKYEYERSKKYVGKDGTAISNMTYNGVHYAQPGVISNSTTKNNILYEGKGVFSSETYKIYSYEQIEQGKPIVIKKVEGKKLIVTKNT